MTDESKIRPMPGKENKFRAACDALKREAGAIIEMAEVMAEIRRAHYDAYIKKGFSPEQALTLCQKATL